MWTVARHRRDDTRVSTCKLRHSNFGGATSCVWRARCRQERVPPPRFTFMSSFSAGRYQSGAAKLMRSFLSRAEFVVVSWAMAESGWIQAPDDDAWGTGVSRRANCNTAESQRRHQPDFSNGAAQFFLFGVRSPLILPICATWNGCA
ncbi:hypothetical protein FGB62_22g813 [Gracilaria domingensis]|nr:hypothetical protein FGB62_22g813 [Gracilaria domingensis]